MKQGLVSILVITLTTSAIAESIAGWDVQYIQETQLKVIPAIEAIRQAGMGVNYGAIIVGDGGKDTKIMFMDFVLGGFPDTLNGFQVLSYASFESPVHAGNIQSFICSVKYQVNTDSDENLYDKEPKVENYYGTTTLAGKPDDKNQQTFDDLNPNDKRNDEKGPWSAATRDLERIYVSQKIEFEGKEFWIQKCGAARTIDDAAGDLQMVTGVTYKTYFGYKIYHPASGLLFTYADTSNAYEVIIADQASLVLMTLSTTITALALAIF